MAGYFPDRGDIVHLEFTPAAGREMIGPHYAIVVTPQEFSRATRKAFVCPITSTIRNWPFEVKVPAGMLPPKKGEKRSAESVILTDQMRAVDYAARNARKVAHAPADVLQEVLEKLLAIIDDGADN
jgi:mRNA interferase MazF